MTQVIYDEARDLIGIDAPGEIPPRRLRALPGRYYAGGRNWCYPVVAVLDLVEQYRLTISPKAQAVLDRQVRGIAASHATEIETALQIALRDTLRKYQVAGVAYALERRKTINADDMGLGKSLQAVAALLSDDRWPALIVCPASLRGNWVREFEKWAPHITTGIVDQGVIPDAQVIVCSYEAFTRAARTQLRHLGIQAMILDEAHYAKEMRSQRTRAAHEFAAGLPADALVLLLTGTPLLNRPSELISPLKMLGYLKTPEDVARFKKRFCKSDGVPGDKGSANEDELARYLRAACMMRRLKSDVLHELPDKRRHALWRPLDPAGLAEYERLAREGLEYAMTTKVAQLVYLGKLRQAIGQAKVGQALDWADDVLTSGEQLVIFANHVPVQKALIDGLRERGHQVTHILGGQTIKQTESHKARFQSHLSNVMVCSLKAAGTGHTLTAASKVLLIELNWTPGEHDQAEDRLHRIGQERNVDAYYLLGEDTIDETTWGVVEGKREIVTAITDDAEADSITQALMAELIRRYGAQAAA